MGNVRVGRLACVLAVAFVLIAGGCSSSSSSKDASSDSGSSTASSSGSTSSGSSASYAKFDKSIQAELKKVGCYSGNVDGILGPQTDAAIRAFQAAAGLTVDGQLGPETDKALRQDAAAGKTVCGSSSSGGSTTAPPTTANGGTAPCTATALLAALGQPNQNLTSYFCSEGWAAGTYENGTTSGRFIFQSNNGAWTKPSQDPCGSASAGIPPLILTTGCTTPGASS